MSVLQKIDDVEIDLANSRDAMRKSQEKNAFTHLCYAVEGLTEICKLLSSGLSDLAKQTSLLAAACRKDGHDT